jgi:hypothetical protein
MIVDLAPDPHRHHRSSSDHGLHAATLVHLTKSVTEH